MANIFGQPQNNFWQTPFGQTIGQVGPGIAGWLLGGPLWAGIGSFVSDAYRANQRNRTADDYRDLTTGYDPETGQPLSNPAPTSIAGRSEDLESALDPTLVTFERGGTYYGPRASELNAFDSNARAPGGRPDTLVGGVPGVDKATISALVRNERPGLPPTPDMSNVVHLPDESPASAALDYLTSVGFTPESQMLDLSFLDASRTRIADFYNQARAGIDTDLTDVLQADLQGIGETSRIREQTNQARLASQAGQFGGLEQLQGRSQSLSNEEAISRALEAGQATGRNRSQELAAQEFVAGLFGQQAGIEAGLTGLEGSLSDANIRRREAAKTLLSGLVGQNVQYEDDLAKFLSSYGLAAGNLTLSREGLANQLTGFETNYLAPFSQYNDVLATSGLPYAFPYAYGGQVHPDNGSLYEQNPDLFDLLLGQNSSSIVP